MLLSLILLSCQESPTAAPPSGDSGARQPAGPAESGSPVGLHSGADSHQDSVTPSRETGASQDSAPAEEGLEVLVLQEPARVCPDPSLRESLGPYELLEGWGGEASDIRTGEGPAARGVTVADLTGDGLLDLFFATTGRDQLYVQQSDGSWQEETESRWHSEEDRSYSAAPVDLDDDGDLDLVLSRRGGKNGVFLNDGSGYFTHSSSALTDEEESTVASSWADADGDGDLDVIFINHYDGLSPVSQGARPDSNRLYLRQDDGWSEATAALPEAAHGGFSFAGGFLDLDGDSDADLYLVNDHGDKDQPNVCVRNLGSGAWEDCSAESWTALPMLGMGLGVGDLNGDRTPDLLISGWSEIALLESLSGGTWYDSSLARGLTGSKEQHVGWALELADLDNDGDLDAPISFGYLGVAQTGGKENPPSQPDGAFIQEADGSFRDYAPEWGLDQDHYSRSFALADLNGDGYLDLVKAFLNAEHQIFMSRCGEASWLQVELSQPAPNRGAIGARVELSAGGQVQVRWAQLGGHGFLSHGPQTLHFGLGEHDQVDWLRVHWPDGASSTHEDLSPRQRLRLERQTPHR